MQFKLKSNFVKSVNVYFYTPAILRVRYHLAGLEAIVDMKGRYHFIAVNYISSLNYKSSYCPRLQQIKLKRIFVGFTI